MTKNLKFEPDARHYFIDIEALGPPGVGQPFALGVVEFDIETGEMIARMQMPLLAGYQQVKAETNTLRWLAKQSPEVIAQLAAESGLSPYGILVERRFWRDGPPRDYLWADDWADFAWLSEHIPNIRDHFVCIDTTILDMELGDGFTFDDLTPHIAVDDAEAGMRRLMWALGRPTLGGGRPPWKAQHGRTYAGANSISVDDILPFMGDGAWVEIHDVTGVVGTFAVERSFADNPGRPATGSVRVVRDEPFAASVDVTVRRITPPND